MPGLRHLSIALLAAVAIAIPTMPGFAPAAEPGAEVPPPVVAEPGYARFVYVRGSRAGTVSQLLFAADGSDFAVTGVSSTLAFVRVACRAAAGAERAPGLAGRQWVVDATILPDAAVGPIDGAVVVRLDHPRQRELSIPVSGFVRPLFAVTPPVADLGDLPPGTPRSARFLVRYFGEGAAGLTGATCDVAGVAAAIEPAEPGRAWRLTLTVDARLPAGAFAGSVAIATSLAQAPSLALPLSGRILGPDASRPGGTP